MGNSDYKCVQSFSREEMDLLTMALRDYAGQLYRVANMTSVPHPVSLHKSKLADELLRRLEKAQDLPEDKG